MRTLASPRAAGFTMVELMVSLLVLAIVATAAVPSFRSFVANQRLRSASFELVSDLVAARSEALKRNAPVAVVPALEGWSAGWIVEVADTGEQLRRRDALGGRIELDSTADEVVFDRSGRVADVAGVVRFDLGASDVGGAVPRCVRLDPTGRARSERRACT